MHGLVLTRVLRLMFLVRFVSICVCVGFVGLLILGMIVCNSLCSKRCIYCGITFGVC